MKILIIGATSAIAQSTAQCFARNGAELFLTGRDENKLSQIKADLTVHGAKQVFTRVFDVNHIQDHQTLLTEALTHLMGLDIVFIAAGTLPSQEECQKQIDTLLQEFHTNCTSLMAFLSIVANEFEAKKQGSLVVITSVAGDRGRQSNYVYGSAKGALNIFLQGLRNRLSFSQVHVLTIKPGFVDTPMTATLKKNFLFASPKDVGVKIYKAIISKKDVIYVPSFWRLIMIIIKTIPEAIFKKLKL